MAPRGDPEREPQIRPARDVLEIIRARRQREVEHRERETAPSCPTAVSREEAPDLVPRGLHFGGVHRRPRLLEIDHDAGEIDLARLLVGDRDAELIARIDRVARRPRPHRAAARGTARTHGARRGSAAYSRAMRTCSSAGIDASARWSFAVLSIDGSTRWVTPGPAQRRREQHVERVERAAEQVGCARAALVARQIEPHEGASSRTAGARKLGRAGRRADRFRHRPAGTRGRVPRRRAAACASRGRSRRRPAACAHCPDAGIPRPPPPCHSARACGARASLRSARRPAPRRCRRSPRRWIARRVSQGRGATTSFASAEPHRARASPRARCESSSGARRPARREERELHRHRRWSRGNPSFTRCSAGPTSRAPSHAASAARRRSCHAGAGCSRSRSRAISSPRGSPLGEHREIGVDGEVVAREASRAAPPPADRGFLTGLECFTMFSRVKKCV